MIDGESITQEFFLVANNPTPTTFAVDLPASKVKDCCNAFSLKVLADINTTDEFKNDVSSVLWWFEDFIVSASMTLQKFNNATSDFEDLIALNNNTYGTYYPFAFFTNDNSEIFIGYKIDWKSVLTIDGAGGYRVKIETTDAVGNNAESFSNNYCLKQYTPERADVTVRVEYYLNNITGISSNDYKYKDLGNINWYNSMRLSGFFGFPSSTYESDYIEFNNGQRQWVEDEQEVEYTLKLKPQPSFVHEIMRTDVLQADVILITDYNSRNSATYIKKQVIKNGEYAPDWKRLQSKLAPVEVKFRQEYNNLKKIRC